MTCRHCGRPIQPCNWPSGCDWRGWVHVGSYHQCGSSLSAPPAEPEKMDEERIARETAQGMAEDFAAMVATNAALLSLPKRPTEG